MMFGVVIIILLVITLSLFTVFKNNAKEKLLQETDINLKNLQRHYLLFYCLAAFSDWLQGPYVYSLYKYFGYNEGKGGKNRRRGKNENETEKRELVFKEDGQEYAQVTKMLGNGRLEAMCFDGVKRLCHIRGKLRKKVWINQGDIVLIGLRDYQDTKADVILKYTPDEARNLKTYGEFPETVRINDTVTFVDDGLDEDIEFGDDISDDEDVDAVDNI
ncbi:eukaryotic translation initiation factor 1A, X-chromosomal-like isoform X1 [Daktulosphaira vitifoliae]|uniref:eukaryotic translation initiation factor 1A, X-chromosomal-like isoform X1 n=1 Tax=Daktulosphaira vitifoliae TaxID=58002 RepID=UPI0021AAE176|nr:eukaryotic translation initiation factor 1A, X-chromosomal-like isoform X1 [Daktulosphaira vitifoliae]